MKQRIYPTYTDLFYLAGNTIIIKRKCFDGVTRYINTVRFKTNKVCSAYFDVCI